MEEGKPQTCELTTPIRKGQPVIARSGRLGGGLQSRSTKEKHAQPREISGAWTKGENQTMLFSTTTTLSSVNNQTRRMEFLIVKKRRADR